MGRVVLEALKAILNRMVREHLTDELVVKQRIEEVREGGLQECRGGAFRAEGRGDAKALGQNTQVVLRKAGRPMGRMQGES